ncbi:MAG: hypothetical protein EOO73_14660 [Myxococcales bacterium]|nr:MAG: hypothetical protein EOO73_14660 [Myxococcales bacterium]
MPSYRSGLGFSASIPHATQRYCYARSSALDQLLAAPGALELLLTELTGEPPLPGSVVDQLAQLKRHAIHRSVTRTAFHGLSLEEIVVLCAYTSPYFEDSSFRSQLLAEPSTTEQWELCKSWLRARASHIVAGEELGARRWPLVGHSTRAGEAEGPSRFAVAVAPVTHSSTLDRDLPGLGVESGFAHEHYIACTPATALDYVRRAATLGGILRWDPFALDRRLRSLGLGLLLVEGREVSVYLPARYHPSPLGISSAPPPSGAIPR